MGKPQNIYAAIIVQLAASFGFRLDFVLLAGASPCANNAGADSVCASSSYSNNHLPCLSICWLKTWLHVKQHSGRIQRSSRVWSLVDAQHFTWVRWPILFWATWDIKAVPCETVRLCRIRVCFSSGNIRTAAHPKNPGLMMAARGMPLMMSHSRFLLGHVCGADLIVNLRR